MRVIVTVEFADEGTKSGTHRYRGGAPRTLVYCVHILTSHEVAQGNE